MGKRQHQSDKMYLTTTEWSNFYGGYKKRMKGDSFRRLPLSHCCLSLVPFNSPYMDPKGNLFELEAILPYVRKFKLNPVTGEPLSEKQLTAVKFHKSGEDTKDEDLAPQYHCPVLFKPFTNNTHVVAIKSTGNVFSYEAVEQLNIKPGNWKELLTDTNFSRSDIVTLQHPEHLDKFNISQFYHIKVSSVQDEEFVKDKQKSRLKNVSKDAQAILDTLEKTYKTASLEAGTSRAKPDKINAAHYSTGALAASLTSTAAQVETENVPAILADHVVRYSRIKKKGYVSLATSLGSINIELYCDTVPKTCENFITLCLRGYYDNTKFHRCIRHFMIQGGDPTGTGKGGECSWGGSFMDEFRPQYSHKGRGVLSMANSGPNTNRSQFFITFRSCTHLDGKHTIFGRVVGGLDTLRHMEAVETDKFDAPVNDISLLRANVFINPYAEVDEKIVSERAAEAAKAAAEAEELKGVRKMISTERKLPVRTGIGKFLDLKKTMVSKKEVDQVKLNKKPSTGASYGFTDFSVF